MLGCGTVPSPLGTPTSLPLPVIRSVSPTQMEVGSTTNVMVDKRSNGHRLQYEWQTEPNGGEIKRLNSDEQAPGPMVRYHAPDTPGNYQLTVKLIYEGGSVEETVVMQVVGSGGVSSTPTNEPVATFTSVPATVVPSPTPTLILATIPPLATLVPPTLTLRPRPTSTSTIPPKSVPTNSRAVPTTTDI